MNRTFGRRRPLGEYTIFLARTSVLGFDESDFKNGDGGRLIASIVAWGDSNVVGNCIRTHQSAGTDHVCIQTLTANPQSLPLAEWRELASALLRAWKRCRRMEISESGHYFRESNC
jgi:hypothetical protein